VFAAETAIDHKDGVALTFYLTQNHGGWNSDDNQTHNLGRFRLSVTNAPAPKADPLPTQVREAISTATAERTESDIATIFSYWRTTVPEWQSSHEEIERLWSQHPDGHSQLVLQARDEPRTTHMLERGDFLKPNRPVSPGVPAFLHAMRDDAPGPPRLNFARWLVDRQSPTTARAIVNRIWQTYFGRGLIITPEDLGSQGEQPSHPELLDWLSVELMDSGWSLKRIHRLIVTSAAYRQSSHVSAELLERDPSNRLLARGARYRVDGEIVRDIMLAASGLLNAKVGGPSVYPPAPEFLFVPPASYGPKVWKTATGPDRYRRALYTFRFRSVPYPMLQTFDSPNGDAACVRRARSNTPLQALTSLNEPLSVECARALALRIVQSESGDDRERLNYATRLCLARLPSANEVQILLGFFHSQQEKWEESEHDAWQLAADDPEHPPKLAAGCSPADLAAWAAVSRVLLNLDETITRE
jgi:hypothetical protein